MKKLVSASLLAAGLALAGAVQAAPVTLLNVSYDVMRDFYKDYNAAFQKHWEAEHPNDKLTLQMSFGGSSKQARSVIDGLPADVITMNMATDINALVDNGKLVPDNWVTRLPNNSAPFTSATVFIVRKGNTGISGSLRLPRGCLSSRPLCRPPTLAARLRRTRLGRSLRTDHGTCRPGATC